ncbi:MAG TPA: serine hydrolase domain-containing protein [Amnibacterium sp.]|jgi:CubicO group peptidase (beta-lactamase class C family)|nr:serine hydrolase domain-containing protein [Amnibacterium sp.]
MRAEPLDDVVRMIRARGAVAQLVVLLHGGVVLDRAFGCRPDALFWTFSAGKPVTALTVHLLAERGLLDLDEPVAAVWPAFAARGKEAVTVRNVLEHRAGFGTLRILGDAVVLGDRERATARVAAAPLVRAPGTAAGYSPIAAGFVLGEVIRRVTGRPERDVVRELILDPTGMHDTHLGLPGRLLPRAVPVHGSSWGGRIVAARVNRPDVRRAVVPSAGLSATARDLAALYRMLLDGGSAGGRRVLAATTVAAALAPSGDDGFDRVARYPIRWSAGFQLGGPRAVPGTVSPMGAASSPRAFGHNGSNCCIAWADPDRDLVVVHLTNRIGRPLPDLRYHAAVADRILAAVHSEGASDRADDPLRGGGAKGRGASGSIGPVEES